MCLRHSREVHRLVGEREKREREISPARLHSSLSSSISFFFRREAEVKCCSVVGQHFAQEDGVEK